jgi:hypothetical protein
MQSNSQFFINNIEIKIETSILLEHSIFFNNCLSEKQTEDVLKFNIESNDIKKINKRILNESIILFFDMIRSSVKNYNKINLNNYIPLYYLSLYFGVDFITQHVINFIIEHVHIIDNNDDNKSIEIMCSDESISTNNLGNEFIMDNFLIENKRTIMYGFTNKKILEVYAYKLAYTHTINNNSCGLNLKDLMFIESKLNERIRPVCLYDYSNDLKCKYPDKLCVTNLNINIRRFKDNDEIIVPVNKLEKMIDKYTYGLIKLLPWKIGGFMFSGGLLYDAITNLEDYKLDGRDYTKMIDIDIFFFGSEEQKKKALKKIISILSNKYEIKVYIKESGSVVNICIKGIPRTLQLIFTNRVNPGDVINDFDSGYTKMYYIKNDDLKKSVCCVVDCMYSIKHQESKTMIFSNMLRNFKELNRGLTIVNNNKLFSYVKDINNPNVIDFNDIVQSEDVIEYIENCYVDYEGEPSDILHDSSINDYDPFCKIIYSDFIEYSGEFEIAYDKNVFDMQSMDERIKKICAKLCTYNRGIYKMNINPLNMQLLLKNVIVTNKAKIFEGRNVIYFEMNDDNKQELDFFRKLENSLHEFNNCEYDDCSPFKKCMFNHNNNMNEPFNPCIECKDYNGLNEEKPKFRCKDNKIHELNDLHNNDLCDIYINVILYKHDIRTKYIINYTLMVEHIHIHKNGTKIAIPLYENTDNKVMNKNDNDDNDDNKIMDCDDKVIKGLNKLRKYARICNKILKMKKSRIIKKDCDDVFVDFLTKHILVLLSRKKYNVDKYMKMINSILLLKKLINNNI